VIFLKTTHTKELKNFKLKFISMILIVDLIAVVLVYYIMPLVQNFPPLSENFAFQNEVQPLTHIQQYTVVYILGVIVHLFSFSILMKKIYKYLDKYYRKEKISYQEIKSVRRDCVNIPYKVFFIQMVLIVSIGILFNFIMLASTFAILKFTLMIIAVASIISIILLIGSQKFLYNVILTTYEISNQYEKHNGYRITNSQNLLFQMVPFIAVILIIISLIGYSKAVRQEGFATGNFYKAYMESKNISPNEVNMESLKQILSTIPLQEDSHYYFIISPNDEDIYVSSPTGSISNFVLRYRDYFYTQTNGFLYEKFGIDEQLYAMDLKDVDGQTWYIGFKYPVIDMDLLLYYFALIVILLIVYSILLYIWSHNISNNLIKTTNNLRNIVDTKNIDKDKILPIASNDEFGDLAYYYNKIQELMEKNIKQIHDNQETLMEKERLASLGQLIGGIAHNLKTPIMSISGAAEGLNDLIKEYDSSIDDPEVNSEDHHDIAKDMSSWVSKIKTHTEYMSDVITAVKGQAVTLTNEEDISFTVGELLKRVNILMRHELKNAIIYLNESMKIDENTVIHGDVNSLVQVINNMISNSIQAYEGKTEQNIDLIVEKQDDNLLISIKDYASGLSKKVKDKLFKEMITTKGKNGTGLGLYMSYSTIRAHFNGNITVESEEGKGTTFHIILPL
jgi:signal transduction histidine kinase